jgi:broad specificity phosphatase PhoE
MIEDERLIKINWGSVKLENRKQHEKRRYEVGVLDYRFPDGENGRDVVERTKLFIRELVQIIKLRDFENIIIVSHGFNYRIILMLLLSLSEETFTDLANPPHCFCSQLEYEDGKFLINSELLKYDRSANKSYIEKTGPN